ncbi:MAG: CHAP domain-containing protein [Bacteroidota bacterium]
MARIAQAVLGEATRWREIYDLNRNQLNDPNLIYPGMILKLPAEEPASQAKQETQETEETQKAPEKQKASVEKAEQAEAVAKEESLGAKIAEGSRFLHERGYMYPPNLSSEYYHEPGKVGCCADFVCDSYAEAGFDLAAGMREQGYNTAWCPDMLAYFQNHQQVISPEGKARVGDVVFFNWDDEPDPEHVGVVSEVDDQGRPTEVIESKSFGSPSVVTALSWDPPSGRASCIAAYGRLS